MTSTSLSCTFRWWVECVTNSLWPASLRLMFALLTIDGKNSYVQMQPKCRSKDMQPTSDHGWQSRSNLELAFESRISNFYRGIQICNIWLAACGAIPDDGAVHLVLSHRTQPSHVEPSGSTGHPNCLEQRAHQELHLCETQASFLNNRPFFAVHMVLRNIEEIPADRHLRMCKKQTWNRGWNYGKP